MSEQHRQDLRAQFPALANKIYLNYGGEGPLSQAARNAIFQSYDRLQQSGPFSLKANIWVQECAQNLRRSIAEELGVAPETVAVTEDVTAGCNVALWGIDWKPGDALVMTDCEHPGVIATVQELQHRFNIEVSVCPILDTLNDGDPVEVISRYLTPKTRLVVLSHILWNTGQVLPLADIVTACRSVSTESGQPIRVLADAAQSVGVLPLKLAESGVDFYAFTGHKWLCGPEGVGGLYVSPEAMESLRPTFIGWRGVEVDATGQPTRWKPDARRYEIATSAYPLYAGLAAAIDLHRQWGTAEDRYRQICHSSGRLWEQLREIPGVTCLRTSPPESGLVSFTLDSGAHKDLVVFLEGRSIMTRTILDPSCVRACVHYLTTAEEIDRLVEGVRAFTAQSGHS
ncbi:aminotransferase class V-fold PLP-dependent enzyme [Baaleninema sp.]|uniref:aminotransferase class V-fold PLP-dependent enzyme n=1 Tax=Baaleninema sp. TaxID=3101197 RepID=UPI003CFC54EF